MNRIVYTSFLLGASFASTEAQVSTPPNIVLILCDDMGFSDLDFTSVATQIGESHVVT